MSTDPTKAPCGLLLAMMEPPSSMEEEFQDWYDNEHFPERAGTEGFATAQRLICVQGWPRYLALYDLASLAVLDGPGYAAIARNRSIAGQAGFIGGKTGHTTEASGNLLSIFDYHNHPVLIVVMGTTDRFGDTTKLLSWFKSNFK